MLRKLLAASGLVAVLAMASFPAFGAAQVFTETVHRQTEVFHDAGIPVRVVTAGDDIALASLQDVASVPRLSPFLLPLWRDQPGLPCSLVHP
jgi:hypothetical protein